MGRFNAWAIDDGDDEVEVDESRSDHALEPWHDVFWQRDGAIVLRDPDVVGDPGDGNDDSVRFGRGDADRSPPESPALCADRDDAGDDYENEENDDDVSLEEPSYLGSIHLIGVRRRVRRRSCGEEKEEKERVEKKGYSSDDDDEGTVDQTRFFAVSERPTEVPRYVRRALPQARNESRSRLWHSTGALRVSEWEPLKGDRKERWRHSPRLSPLSSPREDPSAGTWNEPRNMRWSVSAVLWGFLAACVIIRLSSTRREYFAASISSACQSVRHVLSELTENVSGLGSTNGAMAYEPCPLIFPSPLSSGDKGLHESELSVEDFLRKEIVGQGQAIRKIARGLDYWAESSAAVAGIDVTEAASLHTDRGKPYVVILSGLEGVGKTAIARRISHLLCRLCPHGQAGVLELHGIDFETASSSDSSGESDNQDNGPEHERTARTEFEMARDSLTQAVVEHLRKQDGAGAVVILRQMNRMHPSLIGELLRPLSNGSRAVLSYKKTTSSGYFETVEASCRNVLFMLTTDVGKRSIVQATRLHGESSRIPLPELERSVRNEIKDHFGGYFNFEQAVDIVVPLMVLGSVEIQQIMRQKVEAISRPMDGNLWKRLDITDEALSILVGPKYVDYLRFVSKEEAEKGSRAVSRSGAHTLENGLLMQMLKGRVMRQLVGRSDMVAVFSISADRMDTTLSWCPDSQTPYTDMTGVKCEEIWRESLH